MAVETMASGVVAFLATYTLHSALLCGLAWLVARRFERRAPAAAEALLKAALIGGVFTAALQFGLGFEPLGGRFSLRSAAPSGTRTTTVELAPLARADDLAAFQSSVLSTAKLDPSVPSFSGASIERPTPAGSTSAPSSPSSSGSLPWATWIAAAWLLGVVIAAVGFARDVLRLRRALRWRLELAEGPLWDELASLQSEAGCSRSIRLTIAPRVGVPLSSGLWRGEIALPPRALDELDLDAQRAVLAHELAHLVRRDPLWLWIGRALETVFFFQPLNRVVRRSLEQSSELACDAWARERIGGGAELARALTEVAGWLIENRRALPAPAMAHAGSSLTLRVERLLEDSRGRRNEARLWSAAAPIACFAVLASAPNIAASLVEHPIEAKASADRSIESTASTENSKNASVERAPDATSAPEVAKTAPNPGDAASSNDASLATAATPSPSAAISPREQLRVAARDLDVEIAALERELVSLQRELAAGDANVQVELSLADLETRVSRLIERRRTLRALFGALAPESDDASKSSTTASESAPVLPEESR